MFNNDKLFKEKKKKQLYEIQTEFRRKTTSRNRET